MAAAVAGGSAPPPPPGGGGGPGRWPPPGRPRKEIQRMTIDELREFINSLRGKGGHISLQFLLWVYEAIVRLNLLTPGNKSLGISNSVTIKGLEALFTQQNGLPIDINIQDLLRGGSLVPNIGYQNTIPALIGTASGAAIVCNSSKCGKCTRGVGNINQCILLVLNGRVLLNGSCTNCFYNAGPKTCEFCTDHASATRRPWPNEAIAAQRSQQMAARIGQPLPAWDQYSVNRISGMNPSASLAASVAQPAATVQPGQQAAQTATQTTAAAAAAAASWAAMPTEIAALVPQRRVTDSIDRRTGVMRPYYANDRHWLGIPLERMVQGSGLDQIDLLSATGLEHLANFLQGAAGGLRLAANRIREAEAQSELPNTSHLGGMRHQVLQLYRPDVVAIDTRIARRSPRTPTLSIFDEEVERSPHPSSPLSSSPLESPSPLQRRFRTVSPTPGPSELPKEAGSPMGGVRLSRQVPGSTPQAAVPLQHTGSNAPPPQLPGMVSHPNWHNMTAAQIGNAIGAVRNDRDGLEAAIRSMYAVNQQHYTNALNGHIANAIYRGHTQRFWAPQGPGYPYIAFPSREDNERASQWFRAGRR